MLPFPCFWTQLGRMRFELLFCGYHHTAPPSPIFTTPLTIHHHRPYSFLTVSHQPPIQLSTHVDFACLSKAYINPNAMSNMGRQFCMLIDKNCIWERADRHCFRVACSPSFFLFFGILLRSADGVFGIPNKTYKDKLSCIGQNEY